ncbi:hypothetical protein ACQR1W_36455 [Bradyrhizobium sp. HKCCYLS1011]|uniref:hypothetical protein n=1 Tax=Bradyrhizobium sp. HKCCYLS1011 TaxID=3420733 RepID=UPI003EB6BCB9
MDMQFRQMIKALCLFFAILFPGTCSSLEIRRVAACSGVVLRMRGDIKEGDYSRFRSHFKRNESIVGLDLSSDGGDLEEGLLIADLVHRRRLAVYVAGECDSACAFVFFAATSRHFGKQSKLGVHAVSDHRDIEDRGSMILTVKLARVWAKFGVPNAVIGKMVTTRAKAISYLDQADLSALDASAGDPFEYKPEKSTESGGQPQKSCSSGPARQALK